MYWRRDRAHDKTRVRVEFVECTAGAFIRWQMFDKIRKGEKMTEV